jgi:hypothetical protein
MASNYRNLANKPSLNNNLASAVANNPLFKLKSNPPVSNAIVQVQVLIRILNLNEQESYPP